MIQNTALILTWCGMLIGSCAQAASSDDNNWIFMVSSHRSDAISFVDADGNIQQMPEVLAGKLEE